MFESPAAVWQSVSIMLGLTLLMAGSYILTLLTKNREQLYVLHQHAGKATILQAFITNFLTQGMVDDRLGQLAEQYNAAVQNQAQALRERKESRVILDAANRVQDAKDAFWKAHNDARDRGYRVREHFTDYLPAQLHSVN